jgi:alpha-glucosidase
MLGLRNHRTQCLVDERRECHSPLQRYQFGLLHNRVIQVQCRSHPFQHSRRADVCYARPMPLDPAADWWRRAVFYQIYPRSFQDSNGDGIGDLQGIIDRLDYLNDGTDDSLGIDAIWLSPTFPSPMKDFGYDVSDYCGVHPDFGSMADMDRLIAECHRRGIRLLLDYVPNHSSDLHPWFLESRSARNSPRRDWYYWRDPAPGGGPPNNWRAVFGGPAWEWDTHTGQYYLHSFLKEQPDLNWRNPEVVEAMHNVLRFWMGRGVDGFRIDVMGMVLKHPDMPDNPPNPQWKPGDRDADQFTWTFNRNYPDVYGAVAAIRTVIDEFPDRMVVGEVFGRPDELARYYYTMEGVHGLHLAFNFHFIGQDGEHTPWDAARMHRVVSRHEAALPAGAHPCYAFGNHDRSRFISRHNADGLGPLRARAACLLLLGLRSSPFLYYGEEIGMEDVEIPEGRLQDPARFHWEGRDPERTPMQWDASPGRGFSIAEPWLPYGPSGINVAVQQADPHSLLSLYRRAIRVRKATEALSGGDWHELPEDPFVFSFVRRDEHGSGVLVAVNTDSRPRTVRLPAPGTVLLASAAELDGRVCDAALELPPLGAAWLALT